ncbi:MAG: FHA domain-containing protein, partial [Planctomycetaceae bacterium]
GIKVNGERCESKWLMPGDVLSVAKHRFEISYAPSGDSPPPDDEQSTFSLSLMEKAGLARRPAAGPSRPAQRKIELPPAERETDDDRALRYLSDDEKDSE